MVLDGDEVCIFLWNQHRFSSWRVSFIISKINDFTCEPLLCLLFIIVKGIVLVYSADIFYYVHSWLRKVV